MFRFPCHLEGYGFSGWLRTCPFHIRTGWKTETVDMTRKRLFLALIPAVVAIFLCLPRASFAQQPSTSQAATARTPASNVAIDDDVFDRPAQASPPIMDTTDQSFCWYFVKSNMGLLKVQYQSLNCRLTYSQMMDSRALLEHPEDIRYVRTVPNILCLSQATSVFSMTCVQSNGQRVHRMRFPCEGSYGQQTFDMNAMWAGMHCSPNSMHELWTFEHRYATIIERPPLNPTDVIRNSTGQLNALHAQNQPHPRTSADSILRRFVARMDLHPTPDWDSTWLPFFNALLSALAPETAGSGTQPANTPGNTAVTPPVNEHPAPLPATINAAAQTIYGMSVETFRTLSLIIVSGLLFFIVFLLVKLYRKTPDEPPGAKRAGPNEPTEVIITPAAPAQTAEMENLRGLLAKTQEETTQTSGQLTAKKTELASTCAELAAVERKAARLEVKNVELTTKLEEIRGNLNHTGIELETTKLALATAEQEREAAKQKLAATEKTLDETSGRLTAMVQSQSAFDQSHAFRTEIEAGFRTEKARADTEKARADLLLNANAALELKIAGIEKLRDTAVLERDAARTERLQAMQERDAASNELEAKAASISTFCTTIGQRLGVKNVGLTGLSEALIRRLEIDQRLQEALKSRNYDWARFSYEPLVEAAMAKLGADDHRIGELKAQVSRLEAEEQQFRDYIAFCEDWRVEATQMMQSIGQYFDSRDPNDTVVMTDCLAYVKDPYLKMARELWSREYVPKTIGGMPTVAAEKPSTAASEIELWERSSMLDLGPGIRPPTAPPPVERPRRDSLLQLGNLVVQTTDQNGGHRPPAAPQPDASKPVSTTEETSPAISLPSASDIEAISGIKRIPPSPLPQVDIPRPRHEPAETPAVRTERTDDAELEFLDPKEKTQEFRIPGYPKTGPEENASGKKSPGTGKAGPLAGASPFRTTLAPKRRESGQPPPQETAPEPSQATDGDPNETTGQRGPESADGTGSESSSENPGPKILA